MAKFKSLSFWYGLLLMVLTVSFTLIPQHYYKIFFLST